MAEKKMAQNWYLVRELLHSGTQSTKSPRYLGSRIDNSCNFYLMSFYI